MAATESSLLSRKTAVDGTVYNLSMSRDINRCSTLPQVDTDALLVVSFKCNGGTDCCIDSEDGRMPKQVGCAMYGECERLKLIDERDVSYMAEYDFQVNV